MRNNWRHWQVDTVRELYSNLCAISVLFSLQSWIQCPEVPYVNGELFKNLRSTYMYVCMFCMRRMDYCYVRNLNYTRIVWRGIFSFSFGKIFIKHFSVFIKWNYAHIFFVLLLLRLIYSMFYNIIWINCTTTILLKCGTSSIKLKKNVSKYISNENTSTL